MITESLTDAVYIDLKGHLTFGNPALECLTGYDLKNYAATLDRIIRVRDPRRSPQAATGG